MHTIPHLVLANAQRIPHKPALRRRVDGAWVATTWGEYAEAVRHAANAMIALGIEVGDRVAILSYNSPEWVIFDVAAMAIGAVPVGIYFSSSEEEIDDVLEKSSARMILAGTAALAEKVNVDSHPSLDVVVGVEGTPASGLPWHSFIECGGDVRQGALEERLAGLHPEDPATLIFTAAGFGDALGVILTHDNLVFASGVSVEVFEPTSDDRVLSYLPLSHVAEQMFTIHIPAHAGYAVAFAQSIGRIRVDLPDIQPTIFFSVPLVWSGFERLIRAQVEALEGWKAKTAEWSMRVSRSDIAARNASLRRSLIGRVSVAVARHLFTNRVRRAIGFADLRLAFSVAVSANPETLEYLSGLDLVIREVYGLSEASGPSIINQEGATRFGSVGFPFPGIEAGLAEGDEIILRGRSVFAGYLDNPRATSRALRDGWLHTGDLGSIGSDGLFSVTGRKKDIVITTGGKNICPQPIEQFLRQDPIIVDAVIVGDGYDQLGVLVSVTEEIEPDAAIARVEQRVGEVNQRFARAEQIRRIGLLPRPLSVDEGERSVSGTVVRNVVAERFAHEIADLYR